MKIMLRLMSTRAGRWHLLIVVITFLNFPSGFIYGQANLSASDSTLLVSAANDTSQLKQLILQRSGDFVAAEAQNRLGMIFFNMGKHEGAKREFLAVYQQYLNSPEASTALGNLGRIAYSEDLFGEAIKYYKLFLATNPVGVNAQWARYCLVRAMRQMNDPDFIDSAHAYFASPHDSTISREVIIQYDVVRYLADHHQYAQAISEAGKLINRYPASQYVSYVEPRIADYYMLSGDYQSAIDQCKSLINKYPAGSNDAARAQNMLGQVYLNMNNFQQARLEYARVKQIHSAATEWVNGTDFSIAFVDVQEGLTKNDSALLATALQGLQTFVADHPHHRYVPRALMSVADLSIKSADYSGAIVAYDGIINFDTLIIDFGKYSSHSDEMKTFREYVVMAHLGKGMLFRTQTHDPVSALAEYEIVLAGSQKLDDALLNKALCLVDLGRKEEARAILARLVNQQSQVKEAAAQILNSF